MRLHHLALGPARRMVTLAVLQQLADLQVKASTSPSPASGGGFVQAFRPVRQRTWRYQWQALA